MTVRARSFLDLFTDEQRVVIPAIQRDYAQGRPAWARGRKRFVEGLRDALLAPRGQQLDLDFVYGRRCPDPDGGVRFEPLDGQQRLTTLFLLHWYLAVREGRFDDFKGLFRRGNASAFTYETRRTALSFFDALTKAPPTPVGGRSPGARIEQQSWFVLGWRRDPTVAGSLRMLDAIHDAFADLPPCWERLVTASDPPIGFHVLYLDDYGLSDELYVKMNARGKPLTPFEVFKAELEPKVDQLFGDEPCPHSSFESSWSRTLSHRFDVAWTDFLWCLRDDATCTLDARFMHGMRAVALVSRVLDAPADDPRLTEDIREIERTPQPTLADYRRWRCLDRGLIDRFTRIFDHLSAHVDLQGAALVRHVLNGVSEENAPGRITLTDWVEWCAGVAFTLHAPQRSEARQVWMRWIRNLARNTYLRFDLMVSLLGVVAGQAPLAAAEEVWAHIAEAPPLPGFNRQQQAEERLKAQLVLRNPAWRDALYASERHPVFDGHVGFALEWAGVTDAECDAAASPDRFRQCWKRVETAFPPEGSGARAWPASMGDDVSRDWLWERAVLSQGNYLKRAHDPRQTWGQRSLLRSEGVRGWKELLRDDGPGPDGARRRDYVKAVIERIDPDDLAGSLQAVIDSAGPAEQPPGWWWRLVRQPEVLAPCRHGRLHFQGGPVHLVHGRARSGPWSDLTGHHLAVALQRRAAQGGLMWTRARHHPVSGLTEAPVTRISGNGVSVQAISLHTGQLQLTLTARGAIEPGPLVANGWEAPGKKTFRRTVEAIDAEAVLVELSGLLGGAG